VTHADAHQVHRKVRVDSYEALIIIMIYFCDSRNFATSKINLYFTSASSSFSLRAIKSLLSVALEIGATLTPDLNERVDIPRGENAVTRLHSIKQHGMEIIQKKRDKAKMREVLV
jgi:hypothetical protein